MLVHYQELFAKDFQGQYAIPAFNTQNLELTLGIVRAAVAKRAPVIIAVSPSTIEYAGLSAIVDIVADVASDAAVDVPVALHLDHTKDESLLERAVEAGFSSVMMDASSLSFEKNVAATRQAAEYAHGRGVWVQGELGRLRGNEDWVAVDDISVLFTDPDEAAEFVQKTQVDTLAIAVGTIHGIVKFREKVTPHLDIDRIKKIKAKVARPLVLHGASGVGGQQLQQAVAAGIQVVNIDTELRLAFSAALRETVQDTSLYDPRKILGPAIEAVQKVAEENIEDLGCAGKAA